MVVSFKCFNEICDILLDYCQVTEEQAIEVAGKIFDLMHLEGSIISEEEAEQDVIARMKALMG